MGVLLSLAAPPASAQLARISSSEVQIADSEGTVTDFKLALMRQIDWCERQAGNPSYAFGERRLTRRIWCVETGQALLDIANQSSDMATVQRRARDELEWYRAVGSDGAGKVTFTGYYFAALRATLTPTGRFKHPLYLRPRDLVQTGGRWRRRLANGRLTSYYSRAEIDRDLKIAGRGLEIAYVEDPFDAFLFHVQGAGAVYIVDGRSDGPGQGDETVLERMILNYDGENGHAYKSPRSVLKAKGVDERYLTIPGMRVYFGEHPSELMPTLFKNESYVFLKPGTEGPYGVDQLVLTAGHSLAIDQAKLPMGAFAIAASARPLGHADQVTGWKPFTRFAATQDIGGAIKGAGRADVYWGEGEYAEFAAGNMNTPGALYFAVVPASRKLVP